jgi:hypothetical protein
MLHQRIGVFTALRLRSLDQLSLQTKLKEIGQMLVAKGNRAELMVSPHWTDDAQATCCTSRLRHARRANP